VQTYSALNANLRSLAAVGLRAVFDRSSELLGVDSEISFREKLAALVANGKIGKDEEHALAALTDAGGAAIHRGWYPTEDQLGTMVDIIEAFVHRNFFVLKAAAELQGGVPPRSPRKSKKPGK
jgi:hypothetical protein